MFKFIKITTQNVHLPIPLAFNAKGERSLMTEFSKQVENSCRSHAQRRGLCLLIMVTSTPMLGRENEINPYRTDPVKYDLKISSLLCLRYTSRGQILNTRK